jgi:hypothetical protein
MRRANQGNPPYDRKVHATSMLIGCPVMVDDLVGNHKPLPSQSALQNSFILKDQILYVGYFVS